MARKRSPEHDFICVRCGCPCEPDGSRHVGGGQGMKACNKAPHVMLRSDYEAMIKADIASVRDALARRNP